MLDLVFVLATVAFFAASLALTRWLDRLDEREAPWPSSTPSVSPSPCCCSPTSGTPWCVPSGS